MKTEAQLIAISKAVGIHICQSCNHEIDPNTCCCGEPKNGSCEGHSFIPMGCTCGYGDADERKAQEPNCPDYLNDLNAAVEFARYMGTQGWRCACNMGTGGAWECQFHRAWRPSTNPDNVAFDGEEKLEEHYGADDVLAAAICQAGLSALGKWVEE